MGAAELYIDILDRGLLLRIEEETDRLFVGPGELLTPADRDAIPIYKIELMAMVAIDTPLIEDPDRSVHPTPSLCLAPVACRLLGICGRGACLSPTEADDFRDALTVARLRRNPHRVALAGEEGE